MNHEPMRQHEREIHDPAAIAAIIDAATVCRVGFMDGDAPYVVPLNFGHEPADDLAGGRFWFHSATAGRKARLLVDTPRVCVQLDEDLGLITHPDKACAWTQDFRSVMAWGRARRARDADEARHGLDVLMRQHGGGDRAWTYPDAILAKTLVWCVEVDLITAKSHRSKREPS